MNYSILREVNASGGVGKQLKNAREALGWRLEEAARKTGIRIIYLRALEEERFQEIPSGLYTKKYIKKYAKALKLSPEKINQKFENSSSFSEIIDPFEKKVLSRKQLLSFPKLLRKIALSLVIFLCVLYLLLYFKKMFFPPHLTIYTPEKNLISKEQTIIVSGKVEAEADLKINKIIFLKK